MTYRIINIRPIFDESLGEIDYIEVEYNAFSENRTININGSFNYSENITDKLDMTELIELARNDVFEKISAS